RSIEPRSSCDKPANRAPNSEAAESRSDCPISASSTRATIASTAAGAGRAGRTGTLGTKVTISDPDVGGCSAGVNSDLSELAWGLGDPAGPGSPEDPASPFLTFGSRARGGPTGPGSAFGGDLGDIGLLTSSELAT